MTPFKERHFKCSRTTSKSSSVASVGSRLNKGYTVSVTTSSRHIVEDSCGLYPSSESDRQQGVRKLFNAFSKVNRDAYLGRGFACGKLTAYEMCQVKFSVAANLFGHGARPSPLCRNIQSWNCGRKDDGARRCLADASEVRYRYHKCPCPAVGLSQTTRLLNVWRCLAKM